MIKLTKKYNSLDQMLTEGNLILKNNLFNLIADDTEANALKVSEEKGTADDLLAHFNDNNNAIAKSF